MKLRRRAAVNALLKDGERLIEELRAAVAEGDRAVSELSAALRESEARADRLQRETPWPSR